jgi:hypothetical protein
LTTSKSILFLWYNHDILLPDSHLFQMGKPNSYDCLAAHDNGMDFLGDLFS